MFSKYKMFKEESEVGQAVKQASETCKNCLGYGNEANLPVSSGGSC